MLVMGPGRAHTADGRVARPGAAGVVNRPELFERLSASARVTTVSAPPGSGKTVLLRSWVSEACPAGRGAWVTVGRSERDPQRFWLSVLGSLRQTVPGAALVRELTPAPDLDGWAIVERLLRDLAPLGERIWLVIDDLHELNSAEAWRQLELLFMRAPLELRFLLATRHDLRLGLHRLRLEGDVTEIRPPDLRFTLAEARELFSSAGLQLPGRALDLLYGRTEGWVGGLRLAALSLAGHPDPGRFVAEFSGSDRTVAEYLLAEVLDRQSEDVRLLLLRTSVLERVCGPLANALTRRSGGERVLQELEEANAFVASLDPARSWFRYHRLFAELLQLELRRTAPGEVATLHQVAARWYEAHGYPVDAVWHAQAARNWKMAVRVLADHWLSLELDGRAPTARQLLARFPAEVRAADAELAALAAAGELAHGSLEAAQQYIGLAEQGSASVWAVRQPRFQVLLGINRLGLARQHGNPAAMFEEAQQLQAVAEAPDAARLGLADELRVLTLISIGHAEFITGRIEEAERHLEQGVQLAHRIRRPFLEFTCLMHRASVASVRFPYTPAAECGRRMVELAEQHGWTDEPAAGIAYVVLSAGRSWQGRFDEAEIWIRRAERTFRPEVYPAEALGIHYGRGLLELMRGRDRDVLAAFRATERLVSLLAAPNNVLTRARGLELYALVRMGETERAEQVLASVDEQERDREEIRTATAALRLAQGNPSAAASVLAPLRDDSNSALRSTWLTHAFLLEAIAQDALGDQAAAGRALERALDLAEADRPLMAFLLHPAGALIQRHAPQHATHASLIAEILTSLPDEHGCGTGARVSNSLLRPGVLEEAPLRSAVLLSQSEVRVLRYLATHLSVPEIARELSVSVTTVRTHTRHLFAKLAVHCRTEAVARARDLRLLAPSPVHPVISGPTAPMS